MESSFNSFPCTFPFINLIALLSGAPLSFTLHIPKYPIYQGYNVQLFLILKALDNLA